MRYEDVYLKKRWFSLEDLPNEIWRPIKGYESEYMISSLGRVKSLERQFVRQNMTIGKVKTRILKPNLTGSGTKRYFAVLLHKDGERESVKIHRCVALTFLPNKEGFPCINHKNEDKTDNRVDNLEWCTYSYNNTYNGLKSRSRHKLIYDNRLSHQVSQYSNEGVYITTFPSIAEASRQTGYDHHAIRLSCKMNQNGLILWYARKGSLWRLRKHEET